ncbi:MAG: hypothetical protein KGM44_02845 [bacterium]|nr:hypothetical protein [bacterium]
MRLLAIISLFASAMLLLGAEKAPHQLPPGVTQEMFQKMMTPLRERPSAMPAGTQGYLGCIPTMGYHYAAPKNWPFGPIYGYYDGRATFTEIMVAKDLFEQGVSWNDQLKALPGYHIDHVDIWFEPHGHPGYEAPHYDIHAWYMPGRPYMTWCGNASGKKPAWL